MGWGLNQKTHLAGQDILCLFFFLSSFGPRVESELGEEGNRQEEEEGVAGWGLHAIRTRATLRSICHVEMYILYIAAWNLNRVKRTKT